MIDTVLLKHFSIKRVESYSVIHTLNYIKSFTRAIVCFQSATVDVVTDNTGWYWSKYDTSEFNTAINVISNIFGLVI